MIWGGSGLPDVPAGNDGVIFRSVESDNDLLLVTLVCDYKGNKINGHIEIKDKNIEKI